MINYIYQLISPRIFNIKYEDISIENKVLIKPNYLAICHADQRYYLGNRAPEILKKKLPMALIHEACGTVIYDDTNTFKEGQKVVMIPNAPTRKDDIISENYDRESHFLSSGYDGFLREIVDLVPDRVVPYEKTKDSIAAISEFISVAVHSVSRFKKNSHERKNEIAIWGDGSLSYTVACILKIEFPDSRITVVGRNIEKLNQFTFVDKTYLTDSIPDNFNMDHAFECCGGEGSYYAIDDIIKYINPQGTVMLMGVSENKIPIFTRNVLEKGLTIVGSSRSGKEDFKKTVEYLENTDLAQKIEKIVYVGGEVTNIKELNNIFADDLNTTFKTVFRWNV